MNIHFQPLSGTSRIKSQTTPICIVGWEIKRALFCVLARTFVASRRSIQLQVARMWQNMGLFFISIAFRVSNWVYLQYSDHSESKQIELEARTRELTEELDKTKRQLERAMRVQNDFLLLVSHELRTPLVGILNSVELMNEKIYGPLTVKQQKALSVIEENARHLQALINDTLDMAELQTDRFELSIGCVSIDDVCQASLQSIQLLSEKKDIEISLNLLAPSLTMRGDGCRLKQIIVTLLRNAVKFTPAGGQIGLDVTKAAQQVCLSVWDTGIGIAQADYDHLFIPFSQIDSGLNRQYEGAGLGLALTYQLIKLHGGSLNLESKAGQGSRFTVKLPCTQPGQF